MLEHVETDEPSGTWTGLACHDRGLPLGGDVDNATLPLELPQTAGITTFSPVKPQRWVVACYEHHCGTHGLVHVHNVVLCTRT